MSFLNDFNLFITRNNLLSDVDRVLLAVSGGVDSMTMAQLFLHADRVFGVAHCNFQLRGEASELDEQLVHTWCDENGIPFHSERFNTAEYADEQGISIQMAARDLRYNWFRTLMDLEDYSKLATAHHSDDNLETILFNLTRGTGFAGVAGIPVSARRIIRPLLFASRDQIQDYAKENQVSWREDDSNLDEKYSRGLIRSLVVPNLKKVNPSLQSSFHNTGLRLAEMRDLVKRQIKQDLSEIVSHEGVTLMIHKERLSQSAGPSTVLYEILKGYGFNYETCLQILDSKDSTGSLFLSQTHRVNVDRDHLLLVQKETTESEDLLIDRDAKSFETTNKRFSVDVISSNDFVLEKDPTVACIDIDKISFPLLLRSWREGDRFTPIGMQGSKKLSDFLVDAKVPLVEKDQVKVLCSDDEIVWICGYRLADEVKVTTSTRKVLRIVQENC